MEPAEDDYLFLPENQVTAPPKGVFFQCYRNSWWLVAPGRGLVFFNPLNRTGPKAGRRQRSWFGYPQCNTDQRIAGRPRELPFPVEVRQFPAVFVPVEISDFQHD